MQVEDIISAIKKFESEYSFLEGAFGRFDGEEIATDNNTSSASVTVTSSNRASTSANADAVVVTDSLAADGNPETTSMEVVSGMDDQALKTVPMNEEVGDDYNTSNNDGSNSSELSP